jgi:hypothetical protein
MTRDEIRKRDKWLDRQIVKLTKELLRRPPNNRGPFVVTDEMLKDILK